MNVNRKSSLEILSPPICKFSAGRSLSCAMELNVTPPCLLINNLGFDVFIVEPTNEKECCVQSNHMSIPITITVVNIIANPKKHFYLFKKKKITFCFLVWILHKIPM